MKKQSIAKKIVAVGLGGVVLLGLGGLAGSTIFPKVIDNTKPTQYIDASAEQLDAAFQEGVASVEPVVQIQTVTETKVVQSEDLPLVLEHIFDNEGNINYITEDLDDDEIGMIVDRIVFVDDLKKLALKAIEADLFDELDGELVGAVTLDDKDMEKLRLNDEASEILIDDIDFEDKDATLITSGSFKQDDVKYLFEAEVIFRDGEYDELDNIVVTEE